jgi:hypothetical protein
MMLLQLGRFCRHKAWVAATTLAVGCAGANPAIRYLGEGDMRYYRGAATEIDYPNVVSETPPEVASTMAPHTVRDLEQCEIRDMSLAEAIQLALMSNEVIRTYPGVGTDVAAGGELLLNPNFVASVYDPAIQESGVLFGGRGVEAALADFDAQFTSSLIMGRTDIATGNPDAPAFLRGEVGEFQSELSKFFANGGVVSLNHDIFYDVPDGADIGSTYRGRIGMEYRLPLLAGAGTEYTRIAGPIGRSFGGITGVSQGVLVARINNDIEIADLQLSLENLVRDVELAYWDLHFQYRVFDTAVVARNAALDTWRLTKKQAGEVLIPADEAQARDAFYAAQAAVDDSQNSLFDVEVKLRRLLGLPVNDGAVLRPADPPVTVEILPDWYASLTEGLSNRVELRRQKWNIKSFELQLDAARSLTRPRLDFLGGYHVNGFGDDVLNYDGTSYNSFYQSVAAGKQDGWNIGLQMNWPIGLRAAHAQVRNYELRLAKARKVLAEQEEEVAYELAQTFQNVARSHAVLRSNYLRYVAAEENVRGLEPRVLTEDNVDVILRAYQRRAIAERDYHAAVVDYNKALAVLQRRKGTILAYNNINLMEGGWVPEAYQEADRHAQARGHAWDAKHLESRPQEFAVDAPVGRAVFTSEQAAQHGSGSMQPVPDVPPVPAPPEPAPPSEAPPPPGDVPDPAASPADAAVSQAAWQFGNEFQRPRATAPTTARKVVRRSAPVLDAEPESQSPLPVLESRRPQPPSGLYDF